MAPPSSRATGEAVRLWLGGTELPQSSPAPEGDTSSAPQAVARLSQACEHRKAVSARVVAKDFELALADEHIRSSVMVLCEMASRVAFQVGRSSKDATYSAGTFAGPGSALLRDLLGNELANRAAERAILHEYVDQNDLQFVRLDWAAGRYKGRLGPQSTRFVLHYVGGKDLVLHDKSFLPRQVTPGMGIIIDYSPLAHGQHFASVHVPVRASELR